ncbi:DUF2568 domain-containing protein [Demequina mangrovi]|uniref:DUF2568 domain-containing protein n=1 Tax=Demequina mangrovi TaxID=1043493 RepID=A0A1H6XPB6_9MICO|nr:DUF2568 domain-containing protein [Demequina mangrovi]SEJ26395.1 Protein of unknown function [Demequina mangrovi]
MRWLGAGLVFLSELTLLTALAWWPVAAIGGALGWVLAVVAPVAVAAFWGVFLSPRARRPIGSVPTLVARMMLLTAGSLLYASLGAGIMLWIHTAAWAIGTPVSVAWPVDGRPAAK